MDQLSVYNEDGLSPFYRARNINVVVNSSSGDYSLVFNSADLEDAGTYTCQDGAGIGEAHAAWMAVLGQFLISTV